MVEPPSWSFRGLLQRAYRRTCGAGIPEVGTDLVLHCAAIHIQTSDEQALLRPLFLHTRWRGESAQTDPPPPSTDWGAHFGEEVALEAAAVLGEAAHLGASTLRNRARRKGVRLRPPVFSPAVRYAVHDAIARATKEEHGHAQPRHLVTALDHLPCPASEMLAQWVSREDLQRIELGRDLRHDANDRAPWATDTLALARVLPAGGPRLLRAPWKVLAWQTTLAFRRPYRRHGARYGHPILHLIETDALIKAAQFDQDTATTAHVLLSLIDLHEQLSSDGRALPEQVARWNQAGAILTAHGVRLRPQAWAAARLEPAPDDAERDLSGLSTRGWAPLPTTLVGHPTHGRTALAALRQASLSAHRLGHPYAGTTHLLAALLAQTGPAARLLHRLGVDPDAVRSEATRSLESPAHNPS
jgi:hypothetical protein